MYSVCRVGRSGCWSECRLLVALGPNCRPGGSQHLLTTHPCQESAETSNIKQNNHLQHSFLHLTIPKTQNINMHKLWVPDINYIHV